MTPWRVLLTFLLVARSLASSVSTMSAQGRPVTDTRNDAAVEFVSTRTLPFVMISFANFTHACSLPPPPPCAVHEWAHGARGQDQGRRALPLTRACLVHKKVRSVAGGAGPDADKFAAVGASHKKNTDALKAAGYKSTFAGEVPTHTRGRRARRTRSLRSSSSAPSTRRTCGSSAGRPRSTPGWSWRRRRPSWRKPRTPRPKRSAQQPLSSSRPRSLRPAKKRRGDKSDDTMPGDDLEAVVKFVHKKDSIKGWSSYNTKAKRVAFLASLVPVWTERVACDFPAVPPVAAAAAAPATAPLPAAPLPPPEAPAPLAPQPTVVNFSAMTAAERRTHMAALTAAVAAHDEQPGVPSPLCPLHMYSFISAQITKTYL